MYLYLFIQDSRKSSVEKLKTLSSYAPMTLVAERKDSGKLEEGNLIKERMRKKLQKLRGCRRNKITDSQRVLMFSGNEGELKRKMFF